MQKIGLYGAVCLLLIGCGGGGSTAAVTTGTGTGTTTNNTNSNVPVSLSTQEQNFLDVINSARAKDQVCGTISMSKTTALTWNKKLALASEDHAKDISANNYRQEDKNDPTVLMTSVDDGTIREVTSINRHGVEHETFHVGSGTSTDVALKTFPQYTESTFVERIGHRGYQGYRTAGENITTGTNRDTAQKAIDAWIASPPHCINLMNPDFKEVGMSYIIANDKFYKNYWVQEFGG